MRKRPPIAIQPAAQPPGHNQRGLLGAAGTVIADVSVALRENVFQEYGVASTHPEDHEIDYLIAPCLGGIENIGNPWPEPDTRLEPSFHSTGIRSGNSAGQ